jgi:hypothetical protein
MSAIKLSLSFTELVPHSPFERGAAYKKLHGGPPSAAVKIRDVGLFSRSWPSLLAPGG